MSASETWEFLANVVTALGFPFAIFVFWAEQRKARENEAQQTWALLTDNYIRFMELVLENPDLEMNAEQPAPNLSEEQRERIFQSARAVRAFLPQPPQAEHEGPATQALAGVGGLYAYLVPAL
jgi:hypothetical protein